MTLYNKTLQIAVMSWSRNTHPNWQDLSKILNRIPTAHFHEIDTQSEELGLLVAGEKLQETKAQALYAGAWQDGGRFEWQEI